MSGTGCPAPTSEDQSGLQLKEIFLSLAPQMAGIKSICYHCYTKKIQMFPNLSDVGCPSVHCEHVLFLLVDE